MPVNLSEKALDRTREVKKVLWIILGLNLAVAGAKFFYGLVSGSASMQADGIHSLFDSIGNVIGLIGIAVAARPADKGHPYGHAKFETYGSLVIGILLLIAAFEVGTGAVERLVNQTFDAQVTGLSFAVMVVTLGINLGVTLYERRAGKKLKSDILMADASHTFSDALVSVGVIVGLVLVKMGIPQADPLMALFVTVFILASAAQVFRQALRTLSDRSRIPSDEIKDIAKGVAGIEEVHCIRTRGTESEVYVDLHLLVRPDMTVAEAHGIGDVLQDAVQEKFPQVHEVLVHIEPLDDSQQVDRQSDL